MASFLPVFENGTWYKIVYQYDGAGLCAIENPGSDPGITICGQLDPAGSENYQFFSSPQSDPSKPTFLVRNQWAGTDFYFATKCSTIGCDQNTAAVINPGNMTTPLSSAIWSFSPAANGSVHIMNAAKPIPFLLVNDDNFVHMSSVDLTASGVGLWQFEANGPITNTSFILSPDIPKHSSSISVDAIAAIVLGILLALLIICLGVLLFLRRRSSPEHATDSDGRSKHFRPWGPSEMDDLGREQRTQTEGEIDGQTIRFLTKDTAPTSELRNTLLDGDNYSSTKQYRNQNPAELPGKGLP